MKSSVAFLCTACETQTPKWVGQCPTCGEWNTLVRRDAGRVPGLGRAAPASRTATGARPQPLGAPSADRADRWSTGLSELDRALGGGANGV